ncbi:TetR/AcrR family transcriptional regulator [Nocardia amikacinitolerans]|uniref:TetR/AcrR family transcriptional regulator n=1 Tax=Nocardia amikacinitolerans TaxID=756689 RepID=UPI0020A5E0EF|nr:TetR/AcrR family transcriptional regulator C-terminal domain-containing protein [Nocardia amikacinitolerans]MCP2291488.1 transcriptional regulator, TetR family [Nocardia amikacinitolerans]
MTPRKRTPLTRTALNRDYIAVVALTVIDETGLDGFSMRKLGAALGADPMAAYRHYSDQQDLFDGIAAAMFAELEMESLPWQEDWRELLRAYARRLRSTLRRHPNAVPVFATRPVRSPAAIETGNWMIERLQGTGFEPGHARQLTQCLRDYVIGHILGQAVAAMRDGDAIRRGRKSGVPENVTLVRSGAAAGGDHFEVGVEAMLDGFARRLATSR